TWETSLPVVWARGALGADDLSVDYRLVLKRNKISLPDGTSASAALDAEGRLTAGNGISNDLILDLTDGVFAAQGKRADVKDIALDLRAAQTPSGEWHLSGQGQIQDARFVDSGLQVIAKQIYASLPFAWPAPAKAKQGHLSIGAIQWKKQRMGGIQGRLQQQGRGLAFDGQHRSKLFEDMIVLVTGETEGGKGSLDLRLPAYSLKKEVDLGGFVPAAEGYLARGRLEARAGLTYEKGRIGGSASLRLNQGRLRHEGQKLTLTGISAAIDLDDLAGVHSPPGQRLRIGEIQLDKIQAEDLSVNFQVLSPGRLLIEKAGLNWCRGTIGVQDVALATDPGRETALTLDCRGINMAMMLEQLGVAEGSGDVAMNGRIPVRWSRGRLSFDKGYLSSPPGRTGIIMLHGLKGAQQLLEGLPPDTPQRVQMDIAMEALKDYTYKSVDLKLESQADELVFKLALEGKPNQLLPFAYDRELGQFTRVQGKGQADFKGIGIDLNLRSPFNEILNYKKLLKPN
ncbi:MAG: YdbH domain-containing protein, partial [Desulfosarcinaceae bacterium]